jgi:Lrp/AsnC family transcriptional regulator, leucine-responsive regulatory protein
LKKTTVVALDKADIRILQLIQENGRIPVAELAKRVSLSASACARRLRILEDDGVIKGYGARIDAAAVGLPMVAFVSVSMSRKSQEVLADFESAIAKAPEVMEACLMTGRDDYLLRVIVSDLQAYEHFVKERLTRIPGVSQVETSFMLRQITLRPALPLRAPGD